MRTPVQFDLDAAELGSLGYYKLLLMLCLVLERLRSANILII